MRESSVITAADLLGLNIEVEGTRMGKSYQRGTLRRVKRVSGADAWEWRYTLDCSCSCGRYTASYPKPIRLDHILATGPNATVSCGCRGRETACENAEFHTKEECSPAKINALFAAFCHKPGKVAAIAKRYAVAVFMVGAAYRLRLKALVAQFGDLLRDYRSIPVRMGRNALKLVTRHAFRGQPTEVWKLEDDDVVDPHMRMMFGLAIA
jgi:hypothetical protein